jgi:hypothetical protein
VLLPILNPPFPPCPCPQVAASLGFLATTRLLLNPAEAPGAWLHFAGCGALGMATSYVFIASTQYYTVSPSPPAPLCTLFVGCR